MKTTILPPITPSYDPWEAYLDVQEYGQTELTNVEFTTTTLCNMRCEHCAVGYTLQPKDQESFADGPFAEAFGGNSTSTFH